MAGFDVKSLCQRTNLACSVSVVCESVYDVCQSVRLRMSLAKILP